MDFTRFHRHFCTTMGKCEASPKAVKRRRTPVYPLAWFHDELCRQWHNLVINLVAQFNFSNLKIILRLQVHPRLLEDQRGQA
jgi:hypothetical protein